MEFDISKKLNKFKEMVKSLNSPDPIRRYNTAIAIGMYKKVLDFPLEEDYLLELVNNLIPLLNDEDNHVRYYVAESLGNMGFKEAIPYLEKRLEVEKGIEIAEFAGPVPERSIKKSLEKLRSI